MKQVTTSKLILGLLAMCVFYSSCGNKCSDKVCSTPSGPIAIELRDSQDRDLLNPATPGHFDTLKIKQLNPNKVAIVPLGYKYYSNPDRIKIIIGTDFGETPSKLYLADGVYDTIYDKIEAKNKDCCTFFELTAFTYNGQSYPDSLKSRYFIIKK